MTTNDDCRYWCEGCADEIPEDDVNTGPDSVNRCNSCYIDRALGITYPACGLNADWCVQAWYLDGPAEEANLVSGGLYLLDNEDGTYLIVKRYYEDEDGVYEGDGDRVVDLLTLTSDELVGQIDSRKLPTETVPRYSQ